MNKMPRWPEKKIIGVPKMELADPVTPKFRDHARVNELAAKVLNISDKRTLCIIETVLYQMENK